MPSFPNCEFGPIQLRAIIRQAFLPGERIIGWAPAVRSARTFDVLMVVFLSMVPVVGTFVGVAYATRFRRFIILTDTRLIMLAPNWKAASNRGANKPILNAPLSVVTIAATGRRGEFRIAAPGLEGIERYQVRGDQPRTLARLIEGLAVLADDSDEEGRLFNANAYDHRQDDAPSVF